MFVYLSKKISIPNNVQLSFIAWNKTKGHIACGGHDGLLKVIKLESVDEHRTRGLAAQSNLSMNQTLDGHRNRIQGAIWNETHEKLTSSDQDGLIIVWMLYKGTWYEEMINNRNKSVVASMAWNSRGEKICIVYEDGAVIVGSVDGNRMWGKELKGHTLTGVQWSPDGNNILFAMNNGDVLIYDNQGEYLSKLVIKNVDFDAAKSMSIVSLCWYNGLFGYVQSQCPTLCICCENGRIQLMSSELDENPVLIDCGMSVSTCRWSHDGSILAVAGRIAATKPADKDCNAVMFYSLFGDHIRTLSVPGKVLSSLDWEGYSLRIALAVDYYVYFANIRHNYKRCYFRNTLVYTFITPGKSEYNCVFWDLKTDKTYIRSVPRVIRIVSAENHCCLAFSKSGTKIEYGLMICDMIGTQVETRYVNINIEFIAMSKTHVFAASQNQFFVWQYHTTRALQSREVTMNLDKELQQGRIYHVDDMVSGAEGGRLSNSSAVKSTSDPICEIAAQDSMLLLARKSGTIQAYLLPQVIYSNRYCHPCQIKALSINCDCSRVALIDTKGTLRFMVVENHAAHGNRNGNPWGNLLKFERKDVWDIIWAKDNAVMCAIMEKTRIIVLRNLDVEDPIPCSGYLCDFNDLKIIVVLMDDIVLNPAKPHSDQVVFFETKAVRETKDLINKVGLHGAVEFVEANSHPRLWKLVGEASLQLLDTNTAESAFVRCSDYPGVQFCKKLRQISSDTVKRAEVLAYISNFEESETVYIDADRRELSIDLLKRIGNWHRIVKQLKTKSVGDDRFMQIARTKLGDDHYDKLEIADAMSYYEQVNPNSDRLACCYNLLGEYTKLENIVDGAMENPEILSKVAEMFASVGLCEPAARAYRQCGKLDEAVQLCMHLHNWRYAVDLARTTNIRDAGSYLAKYAQHLLSKNKRFQAIELFRKAGYFVETAKLIFQLADKEAKLSKKPLKIKKIYTLGALMLQKHKELTMSTPSYGLDDKLSSMLGQVDMESSIGLGDIDLLDSAWRGVEAYHYLLLTQRQLYDGDADAAVKTALVLREYEAVLPWIDIYCILALTSCSNGRFSTASKAFIRLENASELSVEDTQKFADLAMEIFIKYSPKDADNNRSECSYCESMVPDWVVSCPFCGNRFSLCIASGRPIMNPAQRWECSVCHHHAFHSEITKFRNCPLCHTKISHTH